MPDDCAGRAYGQAPRAPPHADRAYKCVPAEDHCFDVVFTFGDPSTSGDLSFEYRGLTSNHHSSFRGGEDEETFSYCLEDGELHTVPTAAPTTARPSYEPGCVDNRNWHKRGEPSKDCDWVSEWPQRCDVAGEDGFTAHDACRHACGYVLGRRGLLQDRPRLRQLRHRDPRPALRRPGRHVDGDARDRAGRPNGALDAGDRAARDGDLSHNFRPSYRFKLISSVINVEALTATR